MKKAHIFALLGGALILSACAGDGEAQPSETSDVSSSSSLSVSLSEGEVYVAFYNGDRLVTTLTGQPGDAMRKPANQRRTGHSFLGWAQDPDAKKAEKLPEKFPEESRVYYAIFAVEEYRLTFTEHADLNGMYVYGDELPALDSTVFSKFNGWYVEGDSPEDCFMYVPDLGEDGDEVTLFVSQTTKDLMIRYNVPGGYDSVEPDTTDTLDFTLKKITTNETGKYFACWSLARGENNYGEYDEDLLIEDKLTDSSEYASYIKEEDSILVIDLYPVIANETYKITLLDRDGASLGDFSNQREIQFGSLLPDFDAYLDANPTTDYVGLSGWSTNRFGSQSASDTYTAVPDFGDNGDEITLYANLKTVSFKIHFASGEGTYENGETEYDSTGLYEGDAIPNFLPSNGNKFNGGFYVVQSKERYQLYTRIPKLNDATLFDIPDDGVYTFEPATSTIYFKTKYATGISLETCQEYFNFPYSITDRNNLKRSASFAGGLTAGSRGTEGMVFSKDLRNNPTKIRDMLEIDGYTLSGIEIYRSLDGETNWTFFKKLEPSNSCMITGIKYDNMFDGNNNSWVWIKMIWEAESYSLPIYKTETGAASDYTLTWTRSTSTTSTARITNSSGDAVGWETVVQKVTGTKASENHYGLLAKISNPYASPATTSTKYLGYWYRYVYEYQKKDNLAYLNQIDQNPVVEASTTTIIDRLYIGYAVL
ncbi:MAG: hypothetical protein IJ247_02850 [Bacilli bacterium]|nr:hypothetical protein [Bacilli bacterium]